MENNIDWASQDYYWDGTTRVSDNDDWRDWIKGDDGKYSKQ